MNPARILTVLGSAVLYGWSFPPAPWHALAWVALVPVFLALRRVAMGRAVVIAWLWTVVMAYVVNDWFPRAVSGYFGQPALVGFGLFLGVATLTAALQYMAFAAAYVRIVRCSSAATPLLVAAAWVAADLGRVQLFGGDPWALLGYSQVPLTPLIQVADLTGVHGVTFLVVAVNAAIAELWWRARADGTRWSGLRGAAVVGAVVLAALGYGALRIADQGSVRHDGIPVGIVQANLPIGSQWRREFYGRNLETYLRMSVELLRGPGAPRLLVWPENAMTFFLADEAPYRQSIASVLEPFAAQLIAGGPVAGDGDADYRNAAFLIDAQGEILGDYEKQLLLPFAEYFPFGQIDLLRRRFERVRRFTPGAERPLLPTAFGPVGVMICNEGFFPEAAAARVRAGATVLVNLANDSWLGDPKFSEPAFDMVRLRAVEQRRWIVRASTGGPSAMIDPVGRAGARTALMATAGLVGTIAPSHQVTLYNRVGDLFAWLCVAVAAIAAMVTPSAGRGARR